MRLRGALLRATAVPALALLCAASQFSRASNQVIASPDQNQAPTQATALPSIGPESSYEGLVIQNIQFPLLTNSESRYRELITTKPGDRLDREKVRESIEKLHATGRFSDIRVEADKSADGRVDLSFVTTPNFFVGDIAVDGTPNRPNANQVVNASQLQLGELFTLLKL